MAVNKEIGAGDLIRAIGEVHNDLMADWQLIVSDPDRSDGDDRHATTIYTIAKMCESLIDRIEYNVQDNREMASWRVRTVEEIRQDGTTLNGPS